ncbi:MAG: NHL repeat-containing protein [Proteobacteria bacterium]|nr:NHL repeat-containing protein [Pseudomonadota bacterium]
MSLENTTEDLGCPPIPEELSWLLGSLSSLYRRPFDGALVESQFPPPHTRATFHEAARALGFKTGNHPLPRESWSGLPLPCIAFLKTDTPTTASDATASPADHPQPVLTIKSDGHKVLFFCAGSQTAETATAEEAAARFEDNLIFGCLKHKLYTERRMNKESDVDRNLQLRNPSAVAYCTQQMGMLWTILAALICYAGVFATAFPAIAADVITTVAGGGVGPADGVSATSFALSVKSVAVDTNGNLYIADFNSNRIRKVTAAGVVTTVAGNGSVGYSGDGGTATSAQLHGPHGVVIDFYGNLYFTDSNNHCVRKISTSGVITTVVGTGTSGYRGDSGPGTSAQLASPTGLAIDSWSGNLYIADTLNHRVRKLTVAGTISTVAGTGVAGYNGAYLGATYAQLSSPTGVAVGVGGDVYIADFGNSRVRKIEAKGGWISTVAGYGSTGGYTTDNVPATSAQLNAPAAVAVDTADTVYIVEFGKHRVRKVVGATIFAVAGTGTAGFAGDNALATSALMYNPSGMVVGADGLVYVADSGNNRIRKISADGIITSVAGNGSAGRYSGDGGPAVSAQLDTPNAAVVDADGNLYVADTGNHRIRKVTTTGIISTIAGTGVATYAAYGSSANQAFLNQPYSVAVDTAGNLYIADTYNNLIRKVTTNGLITTIAGTGTGGYGGDNGSGLQAQLSYPMGISIDTSGKLYFADGPRIRKLASNGIISTVAGSSTLGYGGDNGAATFAKLNVPMGTAVDTYGNLYIADTFNNRVRKVTASGVITTIAGTGAAGYSGDGGPATSAKLNLPSGVAADSNGNLYIADLRNNRLRKLATNGIITTVAGDGTAGYAGDNGPPGSAQLNAPSGVSFDTSGNLYIVDAGNNRIRKIAAQTVNPADCLFSWVERIHPTLFVPAGTASQTVSPYYFRYYATTNSYLGTSSANGHLYYVDSTGSPLDVGAQSDWFVAAGCP